jgi:probable rRNA maturation factor
MAILINNNSSMEVDENFIKKVALVVLEMEEVPKEAELGITLVNKEEIKRLNKEFRGVNRTTDVLAFPLESDLEQAFKSPHLWLLGDVVICPQTACEQAKMFGGSLGEELALLTIHGVLHLLGYDHKVPSEAQKMREREEEILKQLKDETGEA